MKPTQNNPQSDFSNLKIQQNLGHRSRLRQKFLQNPQQILSDYELLEILLFSSIPRKDTKIIAKELIKKFGNISAVIKANLEELNEVKGLGQASLVQIKIICQIIEKILKQDSGGKVILHNWQDLLNYAFSSFNGLNYEIFKVLFLDSKHHLLDDEIIEIGSEKQINIDIKNIVKKALISSASSIILMHNHPSGNLKPSNHDIKTTNLIAKSLSNLDIKIIDHLIICGTNYSSFRQQNLL